MSSLSKIFTEFDYKNSATKPDRSERLSNCLLKSMRYSLGYQVCQAGTANTIQKTNRTFLKCLVTFINFTILLPLAIVGTIVILTSKSHSKCYQTALKELQNRKTESPFVIVRNTSPTSIPTATNKLPATPSTTESPATFATNLSSLSNDSSSQSTQAVNNKEKEKEKELSVDKESLATEPSSSTPIKPTLIAVAATPVSATPSKPDAATPIVDAAPAKPKAVSSSKQEDPIVLSTTPAKPTQNASLQKLFSPAPTTKSKNNEIDKLMTSPKGKLASSFMSLAKKLSPNRPVLFQDSIREFILWDIVAGIKKPVSSEDIKILTERFDKVLFNYKSLGTQSLLNHMSKKKESCLRLYLNLYIAFGELAETSSQLNTILFINDIESSKFASCLASCCKPENIEVILNKYIEEGSKQTKDLFPFINVIFKTILESGNQEKIDNAIKTFNTQITKMNWNANCSEALSACIKESKLNQKDKDKLMGQIIKS